MRTDRSKVKSDTQKYQHLIVSKLICNTRQDSYELLRHATIIPSGALHLTIKITNTM